MSSEKAQQVLGTIRDRIHSGQYKPRRRIPSQSEMTEEFSVSGRTIAYVIGELRETGYVWTLPHKGSYARPREDWRDTGVGNSTH